MADGCRATELNREWRRPVRGDDRRTISRLATPSLDSEDFPVIADGAKVGRIYRTLAPGGKQWWRWSVYDSNPGGLADSLDDATVAFKAVLSRS